MITCGAKWPHHRGSPKMHFPGSRKGYNQRTEGRLTGRRALRTTTSTVARRHTRHVCGRLCHTNKQEDACCVNFFHDAKRYASNKEMKNENNDFYVDV